MSSSKKIAVIGAGAAGLATLRALKDAGHQVTAFERRDRVGGLWNDAYEALHLITSRSISSFPGFPQPDDYPDYPSAAQVSAYMRSFAEATGLMQSIRLGVEVRNVEPAGHPSGMDGWHVTTSDSDVPEHFDAVVVANGHLHHKYIPELPGTFDGQIIHSYDYRNASNIDGQRVLVLGGGNSGCDLAADAAQARKQVTMSLRSPFTFLPKALFGKPRPELWYTKLHPVIVERINRVLVRVSVGRPEQYRGVQKPKSRNIRKWRPIINDLVPYWIMHGRIEVKPGLQRLEGREARFADGTTAEFDTILLATGFRYHAPFLSEDVLPRENDMPRRWATGILVNNTANLYFVGLVAPLGSQWPVYGSQAELIKDFIELQDRVNQPLVREFQKGEPGFGGLEVLKDVWNKELARTQKTVERLKMSLPSRAGRVTSRGGSPALARRR